MKKHTVLTIVLGMALSTSLVACGNNQSAEEVRKAAIDAAIPEPTVMPSSDVEAASASDTETVVVPSQDDSFTGENFIDISNKYYITVGRGPNATVIDEEQVPVNIFAGSRNPSDEYEYMEMSLVIFENEEIAKQAFNATMENPLYESDSIAFEKQDTADESNLASILIQDSVYAVIVQRNNVFFSIETSPDNEKEAKKILKEFSVDVK